MSNTKSKPPDDPEQSARFIETAKDLESEESGKSFEKAVKLLKPATKTTD